MEISDDDCDRVLPPLVMVEGDDEFEDIEVDEDCIKLLLVVVVVVVGGPSKWSMVSHSTATASCGDWEWVSMTTSCSSTGTVAACWISGRAVGGSCGGSLGVALSAMKVVGG